MELFLLISLHKSLSEKSFIPVQVRLLKIKEATALNITILVKQDKNILNCVPQFCLSKQLFLSLTRVQFISS